MSTNEKTILILADANPRAAIATLRALKNSDISIHLCFNKRSIINNIIYRRYYRNAPLYYDQTSEETFINSLISIKDAIGNYILLPYGEALLRWAIRRKDELKKAGVTLPTVDFEKYILLSDKESFANLCSDSDIDVPQKINIDWSTFKQKFVIKPKKLVNDQRCLKYPVLVENSNSFQKLKETNIDMTKHLLQEYIDGPSIYYCAYWEEGVCKLRFVQKNIVQQPAGKSVIKAVPYNLPEDILEKIEKMLQRIDWEGVIMIEVKEDLKTHKYYAIEANPRFWGPLQIAIDNGINFPAAIMGLNIEENKPKDSFGYLWLSGYISGFFIKLQTKTDFQKFQYENSEGIVYRDIWLRKDTYAYFFIEPIISVINNTLLSAVRVFGELSIL
jgi:predicted ATP-grasp superfamily ATP-dependent carboligase